ncbi:aminopeptidase N [Phaeovulum vinaykumarii]|uniref:Aminopeptidase N n=1 Tax=Phaeovulum vinaykumarii TaxID=407234 RepID=A0A1N7LLV8_9RHOB|nr:aminopeptidase N [Phaeovulum vinaykumarii]SIS74833.1 aminopeptidase N [Phaeovulum vinaykumarii]SOC05295.1 aminopeptidase N [Phaeovulum vinaykumarii]
MSDAPHSDVPQPTLLADYRPYPFTLDHVSLTFRLAPKGTRVCAKLSLAPKDGPADLVLDGEDLRLISIALDGTALDPATLTLTDRQLTLPAAALPAGPFTLETEVEIDPEANTALEGLYLSGGMFCTQCEAEGFRHITYYPDRPDVMARFDVRIESDMPVLLSNGNPVAQGAGWAEWRDPWPKPAYLFALVAGNLVALRDDFITASGRTVDLAIWVRPGDEDRCAYAMDALKRSMAWDESTYGREYDLDVFNIVAVDDFNMGAMENKGLNIFNAKLVLASPETATDTDYERIESVIAHEYFHNWTGNRITCRDWFQLCLKEGLTVFRDQQFSADERSAAVRRIEDVLALRARQFREDAGPLAHPVRPESYVEINNFYTATVYEKGAEVIGMLRRLVGPEGYRRALDLYFDRHDGQAATIEDWLKVFEDACDRDLTQFKRWYTEAGTPRLHVTEDWDAEAGRFTLEFTQETAATPGQPVKGARVIPVELGLLGPNGDEVQPSTLIEITEPRQSAVFEGLSARPVPSILRGFSAPVILERETTQAARAFLFAHDTDPFNRWEAGRNLARTALMALARGAATAPDPELIAAYGPLLRDAETDPAFAALCLRLPGEDEIAAALHGAGHTPDPAEIHAARARLARAIAQAHEEALAALYIRMKDDGPYSPDAGPAGRRALRLACLGLLNRLDNGARAQALFAEAGNMTESLSALACLIETNKAAGALAEFRDRWAGERLVMDKWFLVQMLHAAPDRAAQEAAHLAALPEFDWKNPNRFRSLMGGLSANHAGFHHASGAGYRFYADWLIRMDAMNPQITARMSTAFETWPRYDAGRQALARAELQRIAATEGLSRDTGEMVARLLAAGG